MDQANFFDYDQDGIYEFARCEGCNGPLLGHLKVICSEGVRYGSETVRSFENWLKRVSGFREALVVRNKIRDGNRAGHIRKAVRLVIENVEKKNTPGAVTTELVSI